MHIMLFDLWTHICLCLVDLASLVCRGLVILKKMLLMHVMVTMTLLSCWVASPPCLRKDKGIPHFFPHLSELVTASDEACMQLKRDLDERSSGRSFVH